MTTLVEEQRVEFADRAAWWRWSWSHGQRRQWQAVTDFAALERDVNTELERLAEPDGRLLYRPLAAFTLAEKSPTEAPSSAASRAHCGERAAYG